MSALYEFKISFFANKHATYPQVETITWQSFCQQIITPEVRTSKEGKLLSPALFEPAYRKNENAKELSMLILDYDHQAKLETDFKVWQTLGLCCAAYTTHSHKRVTDSNPKGEDRFRVIVPLVKPIPVELFPDLWQWASKKSAKKIDEAAKDPSRMFYSPSKYSDSAEYDYRIADGNMLDWQALNLIKSSGKKAIISRPIERISLDDERLLETAKRAGNRKKFEQLWSGDTSGYQSQSEAELGLTNLLCFYTSDDTQVERLLKSSGMYRQKHDEHPDYINRTITKARASQTSYYTGEHMTEEDFDISDFQEIEGDKPSLTGNPKRDKYLKQCACNAAKVMEAYVTLLKLLGFKKNHSRLLMALTAIGRGRLGTFIAAQSWLQERYQEQGKHSSEDTVRRDIRKLLDEQAALGVRLISYKPGTINAKRVRFASQFKNHLLSYALQSISISLDIRKDHEHIGAALEAACREVIANIPHEEPTTFKGQTKRPQVKTISDLETKLNKSENELIEQMIAEGWAQSEIEAEFEKLERGRKRRVSESFKIHIKHHSKSAEQG